MASSPLDQVTASSIIAFPCWSSTVAVNCTVAPVISRVYDDGSIVIVVATGSGTVTVIVALPMASPAWAVISAMPLPTAVTSPWSSTVATVSSLLDQVTASSIIAFPCWSSTVAVNCTVAPVISSVCEDGSIVIVVATGSGTATVIDALPIASPTRAVISAMPLSTAVTRPWSVTVATDSSPLDQVTVASAITFSCWSRTVAVNCSVAPIISREYAAGSIVMLVATGSETVIAAVPMASPAWAVISVMPFPTAVTRPFASTVATVSSPLDQVTVASAITFSF